MIYSLNYIYIIDVINVDDNMLNFDKYMISSGIVWWNIIWSVIETLVNAHQGFTKTNTKFVS